MALPMMSRLPPRRRHWTLEMTALVSSGNHWPRIGVPSCRARAGVTAAPWTNCGSPAAVRLNRAVRNQPTAAERAGEGGWCRCALDAWRLAWCRQVESARAEPAEGIEARGLLLVVLQVGHRVPQKRARLVRPRTPYRHEALAARVRH